MEREPPKMSVIISEMSECVLRNPQGDFSEEAGSASVLLAHLAWNEAVGLPDREIGRNLMAEIEGENPNLWRELKSRDFNALLDQLVAYKEKHYRDDQRRIILCGVYDGKLRVEWMAPVAPGVDSKWEVELHCLVRIGELDKAVQFVRKTRKVSRNVAREQVAAIFVDWLGVR